jgi:hypothetical protein
VEREGRVRWQKEGGNKSGKKRSHRERNRRDMLAKEDREIREI